MRNYIKSELYRNFNRLYFWGVTGSMVILAVLANILLYRTGTVTNSHCTFMDVFSLGRKSFVVPIYIIVMIVDMVTSEEQKNNTFKNIVPSGLSRTQIILSKIITGIILSLICGAIVMAVYFGSGAAIFGFGSDFSMIKITNFLVSLLVCMVLWTAALVIGNFMAVIFKSNTAFAFAYAGTFLILNNIINLLANVVSPKFKYIYNNLISVQMGNLRMENVSNQQLTHALIVGIVYIVVFTILNVVYFKRMDVK